MPVTLLAWTPIMDAIFNGKMHESAAGAFIKVIGLVMPFLIGGVALQSYAPRVAEVVDRPIQLLSRVAYIAVAAIALVAGFRHILDISLGTVGCVFVIAVTSILLGQRLSGYSSERKRRTAGLAVALGNTIVILFVGLDTYHLEPEQFCAIVFAIIVVRVLSITLWDFVGRNSRELALAEPE
jgi:predicted Na+-dependent transporter